MSFERILRWGLVAIAIAGLAAGAVAYGTGRADLADLCFIAATLPVIVGLAVSMVRDLLAGRRGVDAIALVSMSAAVALGQPLAGAVVALMYSGGNVLEDIAIARAEHDLRALVDRAPREAHRRTEDRIEDIPIASVIVGDQLLVRAGEVVPVDGVITSVAATIDESALTGEPIPVVKARGAAILSGTRMVAAACVMPLSSSGILNRSPDRQMGLRHRAALGISEESDAIAVVVSEETGAISIAHAGRMIRRIDPERLENILLAFFRPSAYESNTRWFERLFPFFFTRKDGRNVK